MASPVGHALGGVLVYALDRKRKFNIPVFLVAILLAGLPDIDFLFGYVIGQPNKYHHGFTHSFVFVIIAGLIAALIMGRKSKKQFWSLSGLFVGSGVSHIILDSIAKDTSPPFGSPVFWPFTDRYFIFPVEVLSDIHRASDSTGFIKSLFSMHNMMSVGRELLILLPIILLVIILNKRYRTK